MAQEPARHSDGNDALQRQLRPEEAAEAPAVVAPEASVATVSVGKSPRGTSAGAAAAEVTSSPPRFATDSGSESGTGTGTGSESESGGGPQLKKKIDKAKEAYKTTYKTYSPHDMQTAYRIYIESKHLGNTISIRRLAKVSGIPYATLRDHINGRKNKSTGLAKDLEVLSAGGGHGAPSAEAAVVGRPLPLLGAMASAAGSGAAAAAVGVGASLPITMPLQGIQQVTQPPLGGFLGGVGGLASLAQHQHQQQHQQQQQDLGATVLLLQEHLQQQQLLQQRRHLAPGEPQPAAPQPPQPPQPTQEQRPTLQALGPLSQVAGRPPVATQQQPAGATGAVFTELLKARTAELEDTNSLEWLHGLRYSQAILKGVAILFSRQEAAMEHMLAVGKKCVEWVGLENTLSEKAKAVAELILFNSGGVDFPLAVSEYLKVLEEAEALREHFTEAAEKILGGPGPTVDAFRAKLKTLLQESSREEQAA